MSTEKRALLAIALSILVIAVWTAFFAPRPKPPVPPQPAPEEAAPATTPEAAQPLPAQAERPANETAPAAAATEAKEFIVETQTYSIRLGNRGGRILSWRLLKYVDDLKVPLDLIPRGQEELQEYPLRIVVAGDDALTKKLDEALYSEEVRDAKPEDPWPAKGFNGRIVAFAFSDGAGLVATKQLAIPQDGYVGYVKASLRQGGAEPPFELTWAVGLPEPNDDKTTRIFHAEGQGIAWFNAGAHRFPAGNVSAPTGLGGASGPGALLWGGIESTYFASLLLPEPADGSRMTLVPAGEIPQGPAGKKGPVIAARFAAAGAGSFTAVVGPKDYDLLSSIGRGLDRAIDFSRYSLIYVLTKYAFLALRWVNKFAGNYGVSIILLTIAIRVVFFPITYRSAITMRQSAKKMAKIQPRVKAIQERYRKMKRTMETQRQMNDEIMNIYRKEGVNPMGSLGGCLPLLLQMPVFIAFYNLLSVTIELRGAAFFLWIQDLSRMDPYYIWPILMGVSWMVQQWMTSSTIPDPMQRRMMAVMPIVFTFMMFRMPSGLVIYWFFSNVVGLAQQYMINKQADKETAEAAGS